MMDDSVNLCIQLAAFIRIRDWFSVSVLRPCNRVGANAPSTLPMTVDVEHREHRVEDVGRRTVRSESGVVDLSTVLGSVVRVAEW